jgi:hypothetical protein
MLFAAALAGAVLGFLLYNFSPASIFMGDTGSMFLGFVLAASALQSHQTSSSAVALLVPAIALGLPLVDTLLAMLRRLARGRPVFHADREHIHHLLLARGGASAACLCLYGGHWSSARGRGPGPRRQRRRRAGAAPAALRRRPLPSLARPRQARASAPGSVAQWTAPGPGRYLETPR